VITLFPLIDFYGNFKYVPLPLVSLFLSNRPVDDVLSDFLPFLLKKFFFVVKVLALVLRGSSYRSTLFVGYLRARPTFRSRSGNVYSASLSPRDFFPHP